MRASHSLVVYGAGAVGGFLGAELARAGHELEISLVGRPAMVDAVRGRGLIVRDGSAERVNPVRAVAAVGSLSPCDVVMLTVRSYDVAQSITDLRHLIDEGGVVLAMQNGVGTEEVLAEALGPERVLVGTLTVSVAAEAPGTILRQSRSGGVALASMNGADVPPWIVAAFEATGLTTRIVDDYRSLRWSKLLLNMLGAPISAILDIDLPTLMGNSALFRLEQRAFLEADRMMEAQGIAAVSLPGYPVPLARLAMRLPSPLARLTIGRRLARSRGGGSPTMRRDIARGKTEVSFLNGAVAATAEHLGLHAPVNAALTKLTEHLAAHPGEREAFRHNPARLLDYMAGHGVV